MQQRGFTLAELLISMAILGVIATFSIPKVLQAQQDTKYKAIAKEAAAALSEAYSAYKMKNSLNGFRTSALSPYLNYVKLDTTSLVDDWPGGTSQDCGSGSMHCLQLHNGAMLYYWLNDYFCFTGGKLDPDTGVHYRVDPDGKFGGAKAVAFYLYANGRLKSIGNIGPEVRWAWTPNDACSASQVAMPAQEPSWFNWN